MSSEDITQKSHRHTRSAAAVSSGNTPSQNPHNPHHLNLQAHAQNTQTEMSYPTQPSTPPRTPRRDNRSGSHNTNSNPHESGSKQKTRGKNRPKNMTSSPAVKGNDRTTPPLSRAQSAGMPSSAKPISTPSTAVYAGATFHASPAPSALPIPSFYSKSVPDSPGLKGLRSVQEAPSTKSSPSPPMPELSSVKQYQREESPLDIFFKADREEKARARSVSSNTTGAAAGNFQPPGASRNAQTPPAPNSQHRTRQGHTSKSSSSGMFAMELDGPTSPGTPFGPAFSTPYAERINAARSGTTPTRDVSQQGVDRSEALKAYLFSGQTLPPPTANGSGVNGSFSPSSPSTLNGAKTSPVSSRPRQNGHVFNQNVNGSSNRPRPSGRSSGLRQEVTPTKTPTRTPDRNFFYDNSPAVSRINGHISPSNQNDLTARFMSQKASPSTSPYGVSSGNGGADLQGIEDSLRKILKLDSGRHSGSTDSGVTATTAMPNYAGGRVPPMASMNHGVMRS
ncbi:hypothetical protein LOCC1_G000200 [Lachnellula occidentalis]|uniref:Proteophosphoglycan 5 n=1 Tax=Lachnellula occidentalis TaxID=215460 RepID=A0A8H8S7K6_9HELO|nr:hypothetical protein LOCC1_G000200 [Lachnellula occidentalis]